MNAIVNTAPGKVDWREVPQPVPGPGQVLIRTAACGICATDLQMIAGWERTGFPAIPGHEWAGTVAAAYPGENASLIGKPCVAENVLRDGGEVGFEHPGGYGQFLVTDAANVQLLPSGFSLTTAVLIEPLAVCLRGWRRLQLDDPRGAVVLGDGPIGLIMLMLLRRHGVERVCLAGGRPSRLSLARELGATAVVNYHDVKSDLTAAVLEATGGPVPNVIEASGAAPAIAAALQLTTVPGKVLVIGDYGGHAAQFHWNHLLHRELELIGSNASAGAWPDAVRFTTGGNLPLDRLVTHQLPACEFARGLDIVRHQRDTLKVVLTW